jgi:hypothetical protein
MLPIVFNHEIVESCTSCEDNARRSTTSFHMACK